MSVADNKQVVEDYVAAVNRSDPKAIGSYLTDDFIFHSMLRRPKALNFTWPKEHFVHAPAAMSAHMKSPIQMTVIAMVGEGDKVAVEAQSYGEMLNGKIYDNAYHFLFAFKGNKICSVKEYSCSNTASEVFGEFFKDAQFS
jgi:ketosteroid isomerase-like protein